MTFLILSEIVLALVVLAVIGVGVAFKQGGQPPILGGMGQAGYG